MRQVWRSRRAIGEQDLIARFLNNLAIQRRRAGDLRGSLEMNRESLAIRREIGDRVNTAVSLNNIGNVLLDLGDLQGAAETVSAGGGTQSRDRRFAASTARALHNAAESLRQQARWPAPAPPAKEALCHSTNDRRSGQCGDVALRCRCVIASGQGTLGDGETIVESRHWPWSRRLDRRPTGGVLAVRAWRDCTPGRRPSSLRTGCIERRSR
jgi:hypothetical protein